MSDLYLKDLIDYIVKNAFWIYRYINSYILKDYKNMSMEFSLNSIENIFVTQRDLLSSHDKISEALIPYNILALINNRSGNTYSDDISFSTIGLNDMKSELISKYEEFDYVHFSLRDDFLRYNILGCEIIKYTENGSPSVLHTYTFEIDSLGLTKYISENQELEKYFLTLYDNELEKKVNI